MSKNKVITLLISFILIILFYKKAEKIETEVNELSEGDRIESSPLKPQEIVSKKSEEIDIHHFPNFEDKMEELSNARSKILAIKENYGLYVSKQESMTIEDLSLIYLTGLSYCNFLFVSEKEKMKIAHEHGGKKALEKYFSNNLLGMKIIDDAQGDNKECTNLGGQRVPAAAYEHEHQDDVQYNDGYEDQYVDDYYYEESHVSDYYENDGLENETYE